MGLFDTIKCEYKLPRPEPIMELTNIDFNELVYQTKSFDSSLDHYEIAEDGTLWREEYDIEDKSDPNATGWRKAMGILARTNKRMVQMTGFSGKIEFYEFIAGCDRSLLGDYWIEYRANFIYGKLTDVNVIRYTHTDKTQSLAALKEAIKTAAKPKKEYDVLISEGCMAYFTEIDGKETKDMTKEELNTFIDHMLIRLKEGINDNSITLDSVIQLFQYDDYNHGSTCDQCGDATRETRWKI